MNRFAETARVHLALFVTMMVWGVNLSAVKGLTENLDIIAHNAAATGAAALGPMCVHTATHTERVINFFRERSETSLFITAMCSPAQLLRLKMAKS